MNWHEVFDYDPDTGKLFWKINKPGKVKIGREAGGKDVRGYVQVSVSGHRYKAHRIIWDMMNPDDKLTPNDQIDHINHILWDNRISNLRKVGYRENGMNLSKVKNNTSGVTGVSFDRKRGKWKAAIQIDGRTINLGRFNTFSAAVQIRKDAEVSFGFHKNHGAKKNGLKD